MTVTPLPLFLLEGENAEGAPDLPMPMAPSRAGSALPRLDQRSAQPE